MALYGPDDRPLKRKRRPSGMDVFFSTPQLEALSAWDVKAMKAALAAHETGDFTVSGHMYWAMLADNRISDGCGKRALATRAVPFDVLPGVGRGAGVLARKLRAALGFRGDESRPSGPNRIVSPEAQTEAFSQALLMGLCTMNPAWEYEPDGLTYPRVRTWEPTALKVRRSLETWQDELVAVTQGTEREPLKFEDEVVAPGTGEWLTFSLAGDQRPWMHAKMRPMSRPWISRLLKALYWLRFDEVHGLPFRVAEVPHGMKRTPETQKLFNSLKNVGREPTFLAPQAVDGKSGVKIELKEAMSESWKSFEAGLIYYGTEITVGLTGGTQNAEAVGGNYEGARQQQDITHQVKAADAQAWAWCLNTQLLIPFAVLNGYEPEAAPQIVYDTRPPTNRKADAEATRAEFLAITAACAAHAQLEARGVKVPLDVFLSERDLRLPAGSTVAAPPPPAAPPDPGAPPPP